MTIVILLSAPAVHGERDISLGTEILEWSAIGALFTGSYYLSASPVWTKHSPLGGPTRRMFKSSTIPPRWILYGQIAMGAGILFLPNDQGHFNRVTYENLKGLLEAIALTSIATGIAKNAVGRKRPSYFYYGDRDEGRKSFFSGHASSAFCLAMYGSLYAFDHFGNNDTAVRYVLKSAVALSFFSLAGYVGYTRVKDNKHHISDVVAGAIAGSGISYGLYRFHNRRQLRSGDTAVNLFSGGGQTMVAVTLAL